MTFNDLWKTYGCSDESVNLGTLSLAVNKTVSHKTIRGQLKSHGVPFSAVTNQKKVARKKKY